jgi:hypothetical protein
VVLEQRLRDAEARTTLEPLVGTPLVNGHCGRPTSGRRGIRLWPGMSVLDRVSCSGGSLRTGWVRKQTPGESGSRRGRCRWSRR